MAITAATSGRPGPAVLMLPRDVLIEPATGSGRRSAVLGHFPLDPVRPAAERITEAVAAIAAAERPIVIAGGGVHLAGAASALAALQDRVGLPVATTNMGKGSVDERNPLSVAVIGNYMGPTSATHHLRSMITDAGVIVLVGTRTNENGTDAWSLLPADATLIHIDVDSNEVGRNYEAIRVVGDARLALTDLLDALDATDLAVRHAAVDSVRTRIAHARTDHATAVRDLLTPAMGAKVAGPESTVFCLTGDGGFEHVWSEFETAVREDLPIIGVLLNNGILGFQKHVELVQFGEYTDAVHFSAVDHAAVARACGADGVRVTRADEVSDALAKAIASGRPTLVEIITDPDAYPPITGWSGVSSDVMSR